MELKYRRRGEGWICTGVEPVGYAGGVVIPEEHEGLPVVALADRAFANCALTRIHMADSIRSISGSCFIGCPNLTEVTFGEGSMLQNVYGGAFDLLGQQLRIRFPATLRYIDYAAFRHVAVQVQIPETCNVCENGFDAPEGCMGQIAVYGVGLGPVETDEYGSEFRLNREKTGYIITQLGRFRDGMGHGRVPERFNGLPVVELGKKFCTDPEIKGCHVPGTVKGGGYMPFYGCKKISILFYGGTLDQWKATGIYFWKTLVCTDGRIDRA